MRQVVAAEIAQLLPGTDAGAAVALRVQGRTLLLNFGMADQAGGRPVTSDSLFNLASVGKVFDTALLSLAITAGELSLDDPVARYVPELRGSDIGEATLGELATFTSGFSLPQDHPPWPRAHFTWPRFVQRLKAWKRDPEFARGRQYVYSHAGFLLLHAAMERRFGIGYAALLEQRLLRRLGLWSTALAPRGPNSVARLPPPLRRRAVQGYDGGGKPIGKPGNVQGYYRWLGTEQMFSSARDMAVFLAAQLGELPHDPQLRQALELAQRPVAPMRPGVMQAQAWEVHHDAIVGKNGGLNNASSYIGMIPRRQLGVVILMNRGDLNLWDAGYAILTRLSELQEPER